jgi:hypothetical protein
MWHWLIIVGVVSLFAWWLWASHRGIRDRFHDWDHDQPE